MFFSFALRLSANRTYFLMRFVVDYYKIVIANVLVLYRV